MGERLAKEQPADADIVVGVPNSSLSAALGYARASGIPYEMGLIKSQYIARTFIQPTQALRERSVRMKLSPVKAVVAGKRIVLVDDSIVRGTTAIQLVQLLKDAGAKEVHLRIASPPLRFPCFYGIDIQTTRELMAANHSICEMRDLLGADSLAFLSVDGLEKSVAYKPMRQMEACVSLTSLAFTQPSSMIMKKLCIKSCPSFKSILRRFQHEF